MSNYICVSAKRTSLAECASSAEHTSSASDSPNQWCSYTIKVVQGLLGCDVEQADWLSREGYKYGALT